MAHRRALSPHSSPGSTSTTSNGCTMARSSSCSAARRAKTSCCCRCLGERVSATSRPARSIRQPAARGSLAVLVLATLPALLLLLHPIDSADIWYQLATGEWIATHRALPPHDPFGTVPADRPWIVHDWLALLGMHALYRFGGGAALVVATAAMTLVALGLPAALAWRRGEPVLG